MNAFKNISAIQDSLEIYNVVSAFKKTSAIQAVQKHGECIQEDLSNTRQSRDMVSAFEKTAAIQGSPKIIRVSAFKKTSAIQAVQRHGECIQADFSNARQPSQG